jgi:hypothetical protein
LPPPRSGDSMQEIEMKIALFVICGLVSGGLLGVAVRIAVNNKWSPLTGLPLALLMCIGMVTITALFFPYPQ